MTTSPLTIHVDADVARAYTSVSAADQEKIQLLLSRRLQELLASADVPAGPEIVESPSPEALNPPAAQDPLRDRLALLRRGRGIWRDRDDLPTLAELRAEWDRD